MNFKENEAYLSAGERAHRLNQDETDNVMEEGDVRTMLAEEGVSLEKGGEDVQWRGERTVDEIIADLRKNQEERKTRRA